MPEPLSLVLLATSNRGKLRDFRALFEGSGVSLLLPRDFGLEMDVEETGTTFRENALLKARAFALASRRPTLADDSGIIAYALVEEPGVYSARYAGPACDDHENTRKLIERLRRFEDTRGVFVCALALVMPDGEELVTEGRCEGTIIDEERGTNGFGYDAVFYRDDLGRTFGEATPEEKNARSHRGAAVRELVRVLRERGMLGAGAGREGRWDFAKLPRDEMLSGSCSA